jgi:uncharacterized repeat protein (TIGR02543 family)
VGYNQGALIDCYNVGYVHRTPEGYDPSPDSALLGGLSGYSPLGDSQNIKYSFFLEGCTWQPLSQWNDGKKTASELMQQSNYFNYYTPYDFTNVWTMDGDANYPYPELRNAPHRGNDKFLLQYIHDLNGREDVFVEPAYLSPGDPIPEPKTPVASGYLFKGWFLDPEFITPCDFQTATMPYWHMSLYGKWEALSGTVTFNSDGGTIVENKTVICGQTIGAVAPPTKTGYTFNGWVDADSKKIDLETQTMPKADYMLTATWLPIDYTVNFNVSGGTGTMAALPMSYDVAKNLSANTFKKDGYAFMGWAKSATGSVVYKNLASVKNLTTTNGKTVTLYAKWGAPILSAATYKYNSIKISWVAAGGATSYKIYRATSSTGTYSLVYTASSTARYYVNTGLVTGKTYYYKVSVVAGGKTYHHSTYKYAKAVPTTPTVALYKYSTTSIMVSWTGVSGATRYQIFRATSATGTYTYLHTALSTESFWTNTGLTAGRTYYYKVRAYHLEGTTKVYGSSSAVKYLKL